MKKKNVEQILSRELITRSDIQMLFGLGPKKANDIFDRVQKQVESEGKIIVDGRISWRRMYRMMGLPLPKTDGTVTERS